MKEHWIALVKFEFDVNTDSPPSKLRHEGDAQIDFATRAVEEGLLPQLSKAIPGGDGISWALRPDSVRRIK